jgi:hypothetical protein
MVGKVTDRTENHNVNINANMDVIPDEVMEAALRVKRSGV